MTGTNANLDMTVSSLTSPATLGHGKIERMSGGITLGALEGTATTLPV